MDEVYIALLPVGSASGHAGRVVVDDQLILRSIIQSVGCQYVIAPIDDL